VKEATNWPVVLVGTHVDKESERLVTNEEASKVAKKYDAPYFEIESTDAEAVNKIFETCIRKVQSIFVD
jgi:hypothetical protein